ncbi:hypothetical protein [Rhodococcus sp. NCIMB 12038]|uniref:hypothetical protein n=1 Tax=Rhodococcus sp. NCIMB 12038 TaxID=933800 RepID=UPI00117ACB43|nr:hypothetical protein [Rhodococcus sp. NCIMB 12038]
MDLMTRTLAGLVAERTIPAFGPYSCNAVSLDSALDRLVSSTAPIAQAADGHGDPRSVAMLISDRVGVGFGATTGTLFVFHREQMTAVAGVIVGVDDSVVQFADQHRKLRTWPLTAVFALIAD